MKNQNNQKIPKEQKEIIKILPMLQQDIWKILKIERRQCSKILTKMEKAGLIKKTKEGGTFMVERIESNLNVEHKDFSALLSGGIISPCCGCQLDCVPALCVPLDKWTRTIEVDD